MYSKKNVKVPAIQKVSTWFKNRNGIFDVTDQIIFYQLYKCSILRYSFCLYEKKWTESDPEKPVLEQVVSRSGSDFQTGLDLSLLLWSVPRPPDTQQARGDWKDYTLILRWITGKDLTHLVPEGLSVQDDL